VDSGGARPSFGPGVFCTGTPCQHELTMPETSTYKHDNDTLTGDRALAASVGRLVQDVIAGQEIYVVDIVVRGRKGSRVVEVYLDGDQGVGVADLATISRELGFLMDAEDIIKGGYSLNVSSPGEERCLLLPRQFRRHVGKDVEITFADGTVISGRLESADGESDIIVRTGNASNVTLAHGDISKARIKLPW